MNKPTALFVCSVMLYLGCNAWDEVWAGQDFVRAITVVLAMIDAMIVWSLLGHNNGEKMNITDKTELNTVREAFELSTKEMIKKDSVITKKDSQITVLKRQLQSLLNAIEDNPHPCGHRLISEMKSAELVLDITK